MSTLVDAYANRGVPFTMCPNSILRGESGLSDRAIAILCEIMSHRDGFNLRQRDLVREGRGTAAVRSAIEELTEAGYIIRAQQRSEKGKFGRNVWVRSWTPIPRGERDAILDSDGYYAPAWRDQPADDEEPEPVDPPCEPEPGPEPPARKEYREPVAVAIDDTPAQKLLELSQKCGVNLSIIQASTVWGKVDKRLDGDERWDYLRFKIADLAETDYPTRRKFNYLVQDVDDWIKTNSEKKVGGHGSQEIAVGCHAGETRKMEPAQPPESPPEGGAVDEASEVWSRIVGRLRDTCRPFDLVPLEMIQAVDVGNGKLSLWSPDPTVFDVVRDTIGDKARAAASDEGVRLVHKGGAQ